MAYGRRVLRNVRPLALALLRGALPPFSQGGIIQSVLMTNRTPVVIGGFPVACGQVMLSSETGAPTSVLSVADVGAFTSSRKEERIAGSMNKARRLLSTSK
jgi:hypothetical protein